VAVAFPGGHGDGGNATPAGESCFGPEPVRVADFSEQCHCGDDADAVNGGQRAAQHLQERWDLRVQFFDACADVGDVGPAGREPVELEAVTG